MSTASETSGWLYFFLAIFIIVIGGLSITVVILCNKLKKIRNGHDGRSLLNEEEEEEDHRNNSRGIN
jgi:hypothetical protein